MRRIRVGDTVKYFGEKAQVVQINPAKDYARISAGGKTLNVRLSDLKQLGQGMAEATGDSQFDTMMSKISRPAMQKAEQKRKLSTIQSVADSICNDLKCDYDDLTDQDLEFIAGEAGASMYEVMSALGRQKFNAKRNIGKWDDEDINEQGVAEGSLQEFDPGEGGFSPFKLFKGDRHRMSHIGTYKSLQDAEDELEFQKDLAADEGSVDYYKIIDGTGKQVGGFDPDASYDAMRSSSKIKYRKSGEQGVAEGSWHLPGSFKRYNNYDDWLSAVNAAGREISGDNWALRALPIGKERNDFGQWDKKSKTGWIKVSKTKGVAEGSLNEFAPGNGDDGNGVPDNDFVYISKDKVADFEDWMESEGFDTDVPKTVKGRFVVYDYSGHDTMTIGYAKDWDEYESGLEESKPQEKEADYGADYQDMVARVKKLAGLGPLKTVYDPQKRVYRNVPRAEQPKK
jgi:hypothetical protein